MTDKQLLQFIYNRLAHQHNEKEIYDYMKEIYDYMLRLKRIIDKMQD